MHEGNAEVGNDDGQQQLRPERQLARHAPSAQVATARMGKMAMRLSRYKVSLTSACSVSRAPSPCGFPRAVIRQVALGQEGCEQGQQQQRRQHPEGEWPAATSQARHMQLLPEHGLYSGKEGFHGKVLLWQNHSMPPIPPAAGNGKRWRKLPLLTLPFSQRIAGSHSRAGRRPASASHNQSCSSSRSPR